MSKKSEFAHKMRKVRNYYGLTQKLMSDICGFGANTWRLYENDNYRNMDKSNKMVVKCTFVPRQMIKLLEMYPERNDRLEEALMRAHNANDRIQRRAQKFANQLQHEFIDTL